MSVRVAWTKASFECYDRDCVCSPKCSNYEICCKVAKETVDGVPPMKKCVEDLISKGCAIPLAVTDSVLNNLTDMDTNILTLWLDWKFNINEIAEIMGVTTKSIANQRTKIYSRLEYLYNRPSNHRHVRNAFELWAKDNIIKELERLKKVGVEC